jgi:hypothetical protein
VSTPVTAVDLRDLRKKRDDDDDDGGAKTAAAGREEKRVQVVHGVRIRLGADDFGGKSFGAKFTDRRIGGRDITVGHGAPDGGEKPLGVGLIAILPRDKRTPRQR